MTKEQINKYLTNRAVDKMTEFQKYFDILWKEIDNNDIR